MGFLLVSSLRQVIYAKKKHSRGVSALCTKERRPRWVIHKLKWFFLLALIDTYGIQLSLSTGKMNFRRLKDLPTVTKHLAYKWDNLESQGFFWSKLLVTGCLRMSMVAIQRKPHLLSSHSWRLQQLRTTETAAAAADIINFCTLGFVST